MTRKTPLALLCALLPAQTLLWRTHFVRTCPARPARRQARVGRLPCPIHVPSATSVRWTLRRDIKPWHGGARATCLSNTCCNMTPWICACRAGWRGTRSARRHAPSCSLRVQKRASHLLVTPLLAMILRVLRRAEFGNTCVGDTASTRPQKACRCSNILRSGGRDSAAQHGKPRCGERSTRTDFYRATHLFTRGHCAVATLPPTSLHTTRHRRTLPDCYLNLNACARLT